MMNRFASAVPASIKGELVDLVLFCVLAAFLSPYNAHVISFAAASWFYLAAVRQNARERWSSRLRYLIIGVILLLTVALRGGILNFCLAYLQLSYFTSYHSMRLFRFLFRRTATDG